MRRVIVWTLGKVVSAVIFLVILLDTEGLVPSSRPAKDAPDA